MSSRSLPLSACFAILAVLGLASGANAAALPGRSAPVVTMNPAGKVLLSRDEALALAFPKCEVKRNTAYLNAAQVKRVAKLSKVQFKSSVVYAYRAEKDGKWVGTAYFDTHRVRSLRETLMIVVKPDGSLGRIEVLSFAEPREYLPRGKWYAQFPGRKLNADLNLGRKIRGVTGATLTSSATTRCARRVLALDQILKEAAPVKAKPKGKGKKGVPKDPTPR